jgi:hypothetical protein
MASDRCPQRKYYIASNKSCSYNVNGGIGMELWVDDFITTHINENYR